MGWLNWLNPRKYFDSAVEKAVSSRVDKAVAKAIDDRPSNQMLGGVMTALRGGLPGGWSSDHREEALHDTGWNHVAIAAIGNQIASSDITVYQDHDQGQRKSRRKSLRKTFGSLSNYKAVYGQGDRETDPLPPDHPLVRILMQPNSKETAGMFNRKRAQQLRLTGSALIWNCPSQAVGVNGERMIYERYVIPTAIATPVAIRTADMPLGGWRISGGASRWINLSDDGYTTYPGWYQLLNKVVDARQVQVIRLPNAVWLDDGQSPVSACSLWNDMADEIDNARFNHVKRGATPSLWADFGEDSDMDQDGIDRATAKLEKKYTGSDKTGNIVVTQGKMKITPFTVTAKDMCYSEGFQDAKSASLAQHGMPPVSVGCQEAGAFAAYAASMLQAKHGAIQPLCDMLADSDAMALCPIYGTGLAIEIEAPDIQDSDLIEKQLTNDLAAGAITLNQWQAIRGRPMYSGPIGDRFLKSGTPPLDQPQQPEAAPNADAAQKPSSPFPSMGPPSVEGNGSTLDLEPPSVKSHSHDVWNGHTKTLEAAIQGARDGDTEWLAELITKYKHSGGNPNHDSSNGQFASGGGSRVSAPALTKKTKSEIAKSSATRVDSEIQRYSEEGNEPKLAKKIGGKSLSDNEPVDVVIEAADGKRQHGIELKTMVANKANKLTMKRDAMNRKAAWEKKNKAPVHTVVYDDSAVFNANGAGKHDESKRKIFYRRGYGSMRVSGMHEVTGGHKELKQLINTPNKQLPLAAQSTVKKPKKVVA